jgi:hypothetical protein
MIEPGHCILHNAGRTTGVAIYFPSLVEKVKSGSRISPPVAPFAADERAATEERSQTSPTHPG